MTTHGSPTRPDSRVAITADGVVTTPTLQEVGPGGVR